MTWPRNWPPFLVFLAMIVLPVQFGSEGARLALVEPLLLLWGLLNLGKLKLRRLAWSGFEPLLVGMVATGCLIALLRTGELRSYALVNKALGLAVLVAIYWILTSVLTSERHVGACLRVLVYSASAFAAVGSLSVLQSIVSGGSRIRLVGPMVDPNAFGAYLAAMLLIALGLPRSESRGGSGLQLATCHQAILAAGLVLTFSRSAWLGFGLGLLVLLWQRGMAVPRLVLLSSSLALLGYNLGPAFVEGTVALASRGRQVDARVSIISEAGDAIASSPLVGLGTGAFTSTNGYIIHNTPVWIAVEFGLVGVLLLLGWYGSLVSRGRRVSSASPYGAPLFASNIAYIGVGLGIEALYQRPWWVLLALLGVLARDQAIGSRSADSRLTTQSADGDRRASPQRVSLTAGSLGWHSSRPSAEPSAEVWPR